MIRVSVEVRQGTALSRATVEAGSIREAVSITRGRYPGRYVRVMFPIDPGDFFVEGPAEGNNLRELSVGERSIDKEESDGRDDFHSFEKRGEQDA